MLPKIGFVGVGRMGSNMAKRLQECGYSIAAVYDVNSTLAETVTADCGGTAVKTVAEVTNRSDVIFTVVSDDQAMSDIYRRSGDHLFMGAAGKVFINCATLSPKVHIALMQEATALGAKMLETPMASSITQARAGTLFLMCAGDAAVYAEMTPLLQALSTQCIYTGGPGTAASLKALVNMVMNINTAGLAEGLGLADALGLDLDLVRQVFAQTGANSRVLETDGEDMQYRAHDTYFSAAHAAKDCRIAVSLAEEQGLSLALAKATLGQYDQMVAQGLGDLDKSGISELTFQGRGVNAKQAQKV